MRANRTLEIGTGLFVLLGFAALLFLTTQLPASGVKFGAPRAGYHVSAEFENIGDLKVGAPVTMAGGGGGVVEGQRIGYKAYKDLVGPSVVPHFNHNPVAA